MRICKTMSLDTSEHLMIVYVAENKRQLHCISMGIKRCIFSCGVSTKIAYGGSNLQLSMYKLHKRVSYCFFLSYDNEIHTCATVKEHVEDRIFKISYIISHNIYNNRGTALSTFKNYTYL